MLPEELLWSESKKSANIRHNIRGVWWLEFCGGLETNGDEAAEKAHEHETKVECKKTTGSLSRSNELTSTGRLGDSSLIQPGAILVIQIFNMVHIPVAQKQEQRMHVQFV